MLFKQFDPRPQGAESNEAIFCQQCGVCSHSSGEVDGLNCPRCFATGNAPVYGIEVTLPALASRCYKNLDHHGLDSTAETPSACEQAISLFEHLLPYDNWVLATVRPDADSVTAMAVLMNRLEKKSIDAELVSAVGRFDRLGPASGKPTALVSAIARKACDFKLSLEARVEWVSKVLAGDVKETEVAELISAHDHELSDARKASKVTVIGEVAVVVSTHRFATTLGYQSAPVVIAMNPEMPVDPKDSSKGVYRKFTVCLYSHIQCDLPAVLAELKALEEGWGGRGDIIGSPQGVSSRLALAQVLLVVLRHCQKEFVWFSNIGELQDFLTLFPREAKAGSYNGGGPLGLVTKQSHNGMLMLY